MHIAIILVFISYFLTPFQIFSVLNYGVTAIDLSLALCYIIFFKKLIWDGMKIKIVPNLALFALGFILLSAIITTIPVILSGDPKLLLQNFKTTIHFIFLVFFAVVNSFYPVNTKTWTNVVRTWLIIGLFINLFAAYQIVARAYDLPLAWIDYTNVSFVPKSETEADPSMVRQLSLSYGDFFRATSIFSEPSALALFNIYMFIFIFVPWLQGHQPFFKSKTITYIFLAFSVVGLLIAYSMTGVVGLGLVIGGYFLLERVKNYTKVWKIVIFAVIVIFITDFAVKSYTQISIVELFEKRITGIVEWGSETAIATPGESFGVRMESGGKSFEIWKENPIFGVGLGLTYYQGKDIEYGDFGFLAAMAEMGLFGFFSFVGMFAFLLFITGFFIKNPQKLSFLDEEQKRIAGMSFYIMLLLFEINFITGNNLVTIGLWMPVAMIFFIINTYYVKKGINVKEFSLVSVPFKKQLSLNLSRYLNYKMKSNRSSIEN